MESTKHELAPEKGFLTRQKSNIGKSIPGQQQFQWTFQNNAREKQILKETYHKVQHHYNLQKKNGQLMANKELASYKEMTLNLKKEMDRRFIEDESILTIINRVERRQRLIALMRKSNEAADEDPTSLVAQHREDFTLFLWKKKLDRRRLVRSLIQDGPRIVCAIGNMISETNLENIKHFEQHIKTIICKNAINNGTFGAEDVSAYLVPRIFLLKPFYSAPNVIIDEKRVSFKVSFNKIKNDKQEIPDWGCLYASDGPSYSRMLNKPAIKDLLLFAERRLDLELLDGSDPSLTNLVATINNNGDPGADVENTCKQMIAQLLDAAFPTHKLAALSLAYPNLAPDIIKSRLVELGFKSMNVPVAKQGNSRKTNDADDEEDLSLSPKQTLEFVQSFIRRVERELRFYFEFTVSQGTNWRVGFAVESELDYNCHSEFPGQHAWSFGFGNNGKIYHDGEEFDYLKDLSLFASFKTFGMLLDMYSGSISLMIDGKQQLIAFGYESQFFSEDEFMRQKDLIQCSQLIPMLAIQVHPDKKNEENFQASIAVNFGSGSLNFRPNCMTFDQSINATHLRNSYSSLLGDANSGSSFEVQFGSWETCQEKEEDRLALERNNFRSAFQPEGLKSFSHFPPSVYRRGIAAAKIQRAWRRRNGRKFRQEMKLQMEHAALVIQKFSRRLLNEILQRKNNAAKIIQRNWRIKLYLLLRLLSIRFRIPITELHRTAAIIQKRFREWMMYRNSPIAAKYGIRLDVLTRAVVQIQNWWRPLIVKRREMQRLAALNLAAIKIQRLWRGYRLRSMLRKDYRQKLGSLGKNVLRHRRELMVVRATYVIQRAYRSYKRKIVRRRKLETRNKAASKIQAIWKGYWARSHVHLRFSYGEAVFLAAVCKQLRLCHFLMKMYRPCGVVCPKTS